MSMIERLARALFGADCHAGDAPTATWELAPEYEKDEYRKLARAALSAMMDPTEEILRAGLATERPAWFRTHLRHPENGPTTQAETESLIAVETRRWRNMITAALSGE